MARYRTINRQPRWLIVLGLTLGWTALGGGIGRASAQSPIAPAASEPPGSAAASGAMPGLPNPTRGLADAVDAVAADVAAEPPSFVPETLPTDGSPGPGMGLLGMVHESMWGNQSDLWRPLPLSTFFSDGWAQPWYTYPRSSTGAPRQAWINAADGVFYRLWFAQFSYANNFQQNGNAYNGTYAIFTPISQRFQFLFDVPFIESNKGGLNNTYHGNFGDFAVSPRFLLSETQDFSQVVECVVRTPTGNTANGNGQTTLTPEYEFWYGGDPGQRRSDDTVEQRRHHFDCPRGVSRGDHDRPWLAHHGQLQPVHRQVLDPTRRPAGRLRHLPLDQRLHDRRQPRPAVLLP
jgi:hypothetical protein